MPQISLEALRQLQADRYLAPEVGEGEVDARADVYALAVAAGVTPMCASRGLLQRKRRKRSMLSGAVTCTGSPARWVRTC